MSVIDQKPDAPDENAGNERSVCADSPTVKKIWSKPDIAILDISETRPPGKIGSNDDGLGGSTS